MIVRVHGRNIQVSAEIQQLAEDRMQRASRIFDDGSSVDVEFSENANPRQTDGRFSVEITSVTAGHTVRVESDAFDVRAALDTAADTYERQLRRLKERLIQRNRRGGHKGLNPNDQAVEEQTEKGTAIVRNKRFAMKPMTAEEAALQMEMLGHDFFFFLDGGTDKHCVLYHRRDGNLGLIEPE